MHGGKKQPERKGIKHNGVIGRSTTYSPVFYKNRNNSTAFLPLSFAFCSFHNNHDIRAVVSNRWLVVCPFEFSRPNPQILCFNDAAVTHGKKYWCMNYGLKRDTAVSRKREPSSGFTLLLKCEPRQQVAAYLSADLPPIKKRHARCLFFIGGSEGIRTPEPVKTTRFPIVPVMTASIRFRAFI